jgi:hypothetical protein
MTNAQTDNMIAEGSPVRTQPMPYRYPVERCRELRARAMEQARKRKDARRPMAEILEWVGHALHWHIRVTRPELSSDDVFTVAHLRGQRFAVRSPAAMVATAVAAKAAMNPPGYRPGGSVDGPSNAVPFVPAANVTGAVS